MRNRGLERRIKKLEQALQPAGQRKLVPGRFSLFVLPLPEGTPIPPGSHIVRDFYHFGKRQPGRFCCGYHEERVTDDPSDHGRMIQTDAEPEGKS